MTAPDSSPVRIATWNVLHSTYERNSRMRMAAAELAGHDVCLLQEVVLPESGASSAALIAELSGQQVVATAFGQVNRNGEPTGTAVLSSLPVLDSFSVDTALVMPEHGLHASYAGAVLRLPSGRPLAVVSAHLPWGGANEHNRLRHAQLINAEVQRRTALLDDSMIVMGGDFNCEPDSDTMRWLTGKSAVDTPHTFWTEVWSGLHPHDAGATSVPAGNVNAMKTAIEVGGGGGGLLHPSRRIDFLLVHGWAWGRAGHPLAAQLLGTRPNSEGLHASDHYGVSADLWDPPYRAS